MTDTHTHTNPLIPRSSNCLLKMKKKRPDFLLLITDPGQVKDVDTGAELDAFVVFGATDSLSHS